MSIPRVPPLVVAGGAALAQVALARRSQSTSASRLGALSLTIGSACVLAKSVVAFRSEDTTVSPVDVDHAASLVQTGPFRFSRNPMYVGMAGLLLAHAVSRRSWADCVPVALYVAVMNQSQIPAEEHALHEKFGQPYDDYTRRVPRWLAVSTARNSSSKCHNTHS